MWENSADLALDFIDHFERSLFQIAQQGRIEVVSHEDRTAYSSLKKIRFGCRDVLSLRLRRALAHQRIAEPFFPLEPAANHIAA